MVRDDEIIFSAVKMCDVTNMYKGNVKSQWINGKVGFYSIVNSGITNKNYVISCHSSSKWTRENGMGSLQCCDND